jgi:hypothetical protein
LSLALALALAPFSRHSSLFSSTAGILYKTSAVPISFQYHDINEYNVAVPLERPINGLVIVGIIYKRQEAMGDERDGQLVSGKK